MYLSREHLTVLLNALYDAGDHTVPLVHPCADIGELLRFGLDAHDASTVAFTQGALTYGDNRDAVRREYGLDPYEDLPDPQGYVRTVVGTGLVPFENADAIATFCDRHTHPDLVAGHPPVVIGYDQNLFGFRLPETLDIDPVTGPTDESKRPPTNGYALSTGVEAELEWHYTNYDTLRLEDAFGPDFAHVEGQPGGDNRRGFLGRFEFRHRMAHRGSDRVESERGDEAILDGYEAYEAETRKRVILFSNDHGFVEGAHERGLRAQHVGFPVDLPESATASWRELADTLYALTVRFGVLRLPKVTLFGVWDGKDGQDWKAERLRLDVRSPPVQEHLERDVQILEAFEAL